MVDILIEGNNDSDFIKDLQNQIARFVVDSRFVSVSPDVIIVDEKSESFIRLRQKYPQTPIIFLCHDNDTDTTNLNITIKKPFSLAQFLDVLQAANHKLDSSVDGYLRFNDFELRPQKKELTDLKNNISYKLTEKEVKIIKYLYKNT